MSIPDKNPENSSIEGLKLCELCKSKPTITPRHRHCAGCMGKMKKGIKKAANKLSKKPLRKPKGLSAVNTSLAVKPLQGANTSVSIDFREYFDIWGRIQKLAEEEIRPPEMQIIYILKKYLDQAR